MEEFYTKVKFLIIVIILLCGVGIFLLSACDNSSSSTDCVWDSLAVSRLREEKDHWFRTAEQSPIPEQDRKRFPGLRYYPLSRKYVVRAEFQQYSGSDTVIMQTTVENDYRTMIKMGKFTFFLDGQKWSLVAYRDILQPMKQGEAFTLFLPFKDQTNGRETYEGGRYLTILCEPNQQEYCLDFNLAYNPYCAYNAAYSCPLVPEENVLEIAIRAGEKKWK